MNELIEKLKDRNYVRPFGLMTPEEQECYKKVGKRNCLSFTNIGWSSILIHQFSDYITYVIKPDYQPEREFVDLEVVEEKNCLGVRGTKELSAYFTQSFTTLDCLMSLSNFRKFCYEGGIDNLYVEDIATLIYEGKQVYARFRI